MRQNNVGMTAADFRQLNGGQFLDTLPSGAAMPDSDVDEEVWYTTCAEWMERRTGLTYQGLIHQRMALGKSLPVYAADGLFAFFDTVSDQTGSSMRCAGLPRMKHPVPMSQDNRYLFIVLRQWIEGNPSGKLAAYLRTLPAFDHAQEFMGGILYLTSAECEERGFPLTSIDDWIAALRNYNHEVRHSPTLSVEMIADMFDLPASPASLRFLVSEAMRRARFYEVPPASLPTYGVRVETLCFVGADAIRDVGRESMPSGTESSITSSLTWAGDTLSKNGGIDALIKRHRQWWLQYDLCGVSPVPDEGGKGRRPGAQNNDNIATLVNAVIRGEVTEAQAIERIFNDERDKFHGSETERAQRFTPTYKSENVAQAFRKRVKRAHENPGRL